MAYSILLMAAVSVVIPSPCRVLSRGIHAAEPDVPPALKENLVELAMLDPIYSRRSARCPTLGAHNRHSHSVMVLDRLLMLRCDGVLEQASDGGLAVLEGCQLNSDGKTFRSLSCRHANRWILVQQCY